MRYFALAALVASTQAFSEIESAFLGYITEFGKSYNSMAEYELRLREFAVKHAYIQEHNSTNEGFKLGHNKMSDWTAEEYKSLLTYKSEGHVADDNFDGVQSAATPVNWIDNGCVSPIQDQGQCGSCWAFSATSAVESIHCIMNNGELEKFAEQQLVDCVHTCFGCNGGTQARAYFYLGQHYEMAESAYPYTAKDGTCNYSAHDNLYVFVPRHTSVTANSPDAMKEALAQQPLSVAIQADQLVFQMYKSGIFSSTECGSSLDHATNVVGWGQEDDKEYWIMRNSWGTSWGEDGYIKIEIVAGNGICGIQMEPQWPASN